MEKKLGRGSKGRGCRSDDDVLRSYLDYVKDKKRDDVT